MSQFDEDRDETPGGKLDRQWNELLQELRVTQTGIQLLGGFLLILPFQSRFGELSSRLLGLYLVSVICATLAMFFVMTPVSMHRMLFQSRRKDVLVRVGDLMARLGVALLGLTVILVSALIFGFLLGERIAWLAGSTAAVVCIGLWWVLPLAVRRRPASESYAP